MRCDTERTVGLLDLGLLAGTRVMLGVGLGLLVGDRLPPRWGRPVGWALFALGCLSTLPIACRIWSRD